MTQRSQYYVRKFALGLLAFAAVGCASNVPQARDGRAAGEWRFRLPATQSPYGAMALGRGGSSEPSQLQEDRPLLASAQPMPKHVARPARVQRSVAPIHTAAAQPSAPAETVPAPVVNSPVQAKEPVQLAANDTSAEQRYGQREAESKKQEQYRGGDAIVIGAGTLVVILLIVILLILLLR